MILFRNGEAFFPWLPASTADETPTLVGPHLLTMTGGSPALVTESIGPLLYCSKDGRSHGYAFTPGATGSRVLLGPHLFWCYFFDHFSHL